MRIKVDENLPASIAGDLTSRGHDAAKVVEQRMAGCRDEPLWERCQQEGRFLITQDLVSPMCDAFSPACTMACCSFDCEMPAAWLCGERVLELASANDISTWSRCFVIATGTKVRVLRANR